MKKYYLLSLMLAGGSMVWAQHQVQPSLSVTAPKGLNVKLYERTPELMKELEDAFFTEDFANGFAGNNEANAAWTTDSDDGISEWEYRGPSTTPDTSVSTRGSCRGTRGGVASPTRGNGYMIFDSNWWDDPGTDCGGGLGTGPAPGPQVARLTSGSIDMSDQAAVQVFFETWSRPFTGSEFRINVSVDGGPFMPASDEDIFDQLGIAVNAQTENTQFVGVDITELAAGQSDVRLQFEWDGNYYFASVDDIYLDTPPDVDLEIQTVRLDDDINNPIFRHREIPGSQNHVHTPGATIRSKGLLTGDVTLTIDVLYRLDINDPSPVPFTSGSVTITDVERDSVFTLFVEDLVLPDKYGNYLLEYSVSHSAGDDALPNDNVATRSFDVVKNFWADEDGRSYGGNFFQAFYTNGDDTQPFAETTIGQSFYTFRDNPTGVLGIHTLLPNFEVATNKMSEGQFFEVEFFRVTDRNTFLAGSFEDNIFELLTSAEFFPIESDFATAVDQTVDIEYDDLIELIGDEYYVATIKNSSGEPFNIPTTGTSAQDGSGLTRGAIQAGASNTEFVRYTNVNPYIKLIIDSLAEPDNLSGITVYDREKPFHLAQNTPNPANEYTTVGYTLRRDAHVSLEILDLSGKVVMQENYGRQAAGNHFPRIDLSNLKAGAYFYRLHVNEHSETRKMMVTR